MEEEVNQKVVSVSFSAIRLTATVLARALAKIIAAEKARAAQNAKGKIQEPKRGKMTLKELNEQNAGAVSIEVNEGNIKSFDRVARKYGIDYAVKKDKTCQPPKYFVFFKARDQESMMKAFNEFVDLNTKKQNRMSFKKVLNNFKEMSRNTNKHREKAKNRNMERGR